MNVPSQNSPNIISFKAPYRRLSILDAIKEKTGYDLDGKDENEIREICKQLKIEVDETMGKGKLIDEIFGEFCEGTFISLRLSPTTLSRCHRSQRCTALNRVLPSVSS